MNSSEACSTPPGIAYIDGAFMPVSEAKISILDWGFLRSDATYDVAHVWKGRFFRLDKHIERFLAGVKKLRMNLDMTGEEISSIVHQCVAQSGHRNAYVEIICTRGSSPNYERHPSLSQPRFMAFAIPFSWIIPPEKWEKGLHLGVSQEYVRIPPTSVDPTIKNYHWLDLVMGWMEVSDRGADTVLLLSEDGFVCEGAGFNVFIVCNGKVYTPEKGVLEGITRLSTIELCAQLSIPCHVGPVSKDALGSAEEIFVTSTAGGLMPVTTLDGALVGNGKPGKLTRKLSASYWEKHTDKQWTSEIEYGE